MVDLAVIVLTYNEEKHIARALKSVLPFAKEVFVVDSGSSDRTVEISESFGAQVFVNPFINQAKQFQWALDTLPITAEWIMRLDADELIESDLQAEIASELPTLAKDISGINLNRKHVFMDRWIRFGGRYPLLMLRIFRRGKGAIEDRWMDEHIRITEGRAIVFGGGFVDHNLNDLTFFIEKHNKYATREAVEILLRRLGLVRAEHSITAQTTSRHAFLKRWMKENFYNRLPFALSSTLYFCYRYFVQLGFLDGRSGMVYHVLQGFWYRFLVGAKLMELERAIVGVSGKEDAARVISRVTGLRIAGFGPERGG